MVALIVEFDLHVKQLRPLQCERMQKQCGPEQDAQVFPN